MKTDSDKDIELPEGQGCTGKAWIAKTQVWGNKDNILREGDHRVPDSEAGKVKTDLEWICSTPVINQSRNVVAVINFDGNRPMNAEKQQIIKDHAIELQAK